MSGFGSLLKVQLLSVFGINKLLYSEKKNKIAKIVLLCCLCLAFCTLVSLFGYTYSETFAATVEIGGAVEDYFANACGMCFVVCLVTGIYEASSLFYGNKDYDYLSALPLKNVTVICTKTAVMFFSNLLFTVLLIAPATYLLFTEIMPFSIGVLFRTVVLVPFLAVIPLVLSMLVGSIVSYVSTLFRRKKLAQSVIYSLIFLCFYVAYIFIVDEIASSSLFGKFYPLYGLTKLCFNGWGYTLLYCAIGIVISAAVLVYSGVTYKWLNTKLASSKRVKNFRLKNYSAKGSSSALYKKEIGRLFSSPSYALNSLAGCFMAVFSAVVICFFFRAFDIVSEPSIVDEIAKYFPMIAVFMFTMSPPTCVALSIEGNCFWIVRTAPISVKKIFNVKILATLTFTLSSALIFAVIISIGAALPFLTAVAFTVMSVTVATVSAVVGLLFNLLSPKLNWKKEAEVVKQGLPVLYSVIATFVLSGITFCVSHFINVGAVWIYVIITAAFLTCGIISYRYIFKDPERFLKKVE